MQRTLNKKIVFSGIGFHTGYECHAALYPAAPGTGIVFSSADFPGTRIPASVDFVSDTRNRVVLANGPASVETVEHLLAALFLLSIDNCRIEVQGPEVPALDGSALAFLAALEQAVSERQLPSLPGSALFFPVWIDEGERYIIALPSERFCVSCSIYFDHPDIGYQSLYFSGAVEAFREEIAPARTFGFRRDAQELLRLGLARGSSGDNTLVFSEDALVGGALRFEDECVRHKTLDLIGDFALLGQRLNAHIISSRAGHSLHVALLKKILWNQSQQIEKRTWSSEEHEEFLLFRHRIGSG